MSQTQLFIGSVADQPCPYDGCDICGFGHPWHLDLLSEYPLRGHWEMHHGIAGVTEPIIETIPISIKQGDAAYTRKKTKLDRFQQQAWRWRDNLVQNNSLWLYEQHRGEAGLRRSYIHSIAPLRSVRRNRFGGGAVGDHDLQLVRHFCSETPEQTEIVIPRQHHWGYVFNPDYAVGTEPGRICEFIWRDHYSYLVSPIRTWYRGWVGIKPDIGCGLDDWQPIWELETGQPRTDASIVADAAASGGSVVQVSFATQPDPAQRVIIRLRDMYPNINFEQWRGQYIVLLRYRVNGGATASFRLRYGWYANSRRIPSDVVRYSLNPVYDIMDLGIVQFPPDSGRVCHSCEDDSLDDVTIEIDVGLVEGAGTVDLDALYFIPFEHSAVVTNTDFEYNVVGPGSDVERPTNEDNYLKIVTHEDDRTDARYYGTIANDGTLSPNAGFQPSLNRFYLPERGSRIVTAMQGRNLLGIGPIGGPVIYTTFHELADVPMDLDATIRVYPRWLSDRDA